MNFLALSEKQDFEIDDELDDFDDDVCDTTEAAIYCELDGDILSMQARLLVKQYIDAFFQGREMHYGGPIPRETLCSPYYINAVLEWSIAVGIPKIYKILEACENISSNTHRDNMADDICLVVNTLEECARLKIPKCFAAGITLMYLELCIGIEMPQHLARCGFGT